MLDDLRRKQLSRLEDRLLSLKQQNLRIKAVLMHRADTGHQMPDCPNAELGFKNLGGMFSGIIGWRSDIRTTTSRTVFSPNKEPVKEQAKAAASAINQIIYATQCTRENHADRERIEQDFWQIAEEAGKYVWEVLPLLHEHGLWKMWSCIEPNCKDNYGGVWCDFVFEVAWLADPRFPLVAKKQVYWNGVSIGLDSIEKIPPALAAFTVLDSSKPFENISSIPQPVPKWHSQIEDIASASQVALDYLTEVLDAQGQQIKNGSDKDSIETIEAKTPKLDTESVEWIVARQKNEKKLGLPTKTLRNYRLESKGGRILPNKKFGVDKDGRRWRRKGTKSSAVYYYSPSLP